MDMHLERHPTRARRRTPAPPVVLVHGLGGDRHVWDPVLRGLTEEYDVVVVELPGFGDSPALSDEPTPGALAAAVGARLHGAGLHRFHLVGHGLGGWVALELAERDEGAASVTGLAPAGFWPHPSGERHRRAIASIRRWGAVAPLVLALPPVRDGVLVAGHGGPGGLTFSAAMAVVRGYLHADDYRRVSDAMLSRVYDVTRRMTPLALRIPVFLVWAGQDRLVTPPAVSPPDGVFQHVMQQSGHLTTLDEPDRTVDVLLAAVDKGQMLAAAA